VRFKDFSGTPAGAFCNGLAECGKQYVFYLFHGDYENGWNLHFMPKPGNYQDTLTLNNMPAGKYKIEWIDPASGLVKNTETMNCSGGSLLIKTPLYSIDIAARIRLNRV